MHCPKCAIDINDDAPQCPKCGFSIEELDPVFGTPPERSGMIVDEPGVLNPDGTEKLLSRLKEFSQKTGFDFLLVIKQSTAPRLPSEYVFWLFNRWKVGGESHSGMLMLLAMNERRIEVEVGFSLEPFVTDEAATNILQFHAVPFLKKGDFNNGLFHGVDILSRIVE
ncbi:TPM domain-containing protein, partial [bacterium]|nr:TPM domain-containing protein [bacterium]